MAVSKCFRPQYSNPYKCFLSRLVCHVERCAQCAWLSSITDAATRCRHNNTTPYTVKCRGLYGVERAPRPIVAVRTQSVQIPYQAATVRTHSNSPGGPFGANLITRPSRGAAQRTHKTHTQRQRRRPHWPRFSKATAVRGVTHPFLPPSS